MKNPRLIELIKRRTLISKREIQLLTTKNRKTVGDGTIFRLLQTERLKIEVQIQKELELIQDPEHKESIRSMLNASPASVMKF